MSIRLCPPETEDLPVATTSWSGRGSSVSVIPLNPTYDALRIRFQRKLHPDDVEDGNLRPVCQEFVRKGGKRVTQLALSLESAEDLYNALGLTLKRARRRRRFEEAVEGVVNVLLSVYRPR